MALSAIAGTAVACITVFADLVTTWNLGLRLKEWLGRQRDSSPEAVERVLHGRQRRTFVSGISPIPEGRSLPSHRLSDAVYYEPTPALRSHPRPTPLLRDPRQLGETFAPFAEHLGAPVVVTPALSIQASLGEALEQRPEEVLVDPQPYRGKLKAKDASYAPLLFFHERKLWIGWQKKLLLAEILDCDYLVDGQSTAGGPPSPSRQQEPERPFVEVKAFRSSLLGVDRSCQIRVSRTFLEFESKTNRWHSYRVPRKEITGVYLNLRREQLELSTRKGRIRRLEARIEDLRQVREALVEL